MSSAASGCIFRELVEVEVYTLDLRASFAWYDVRTRELGARPSWCNWAADLSGPVSSLSSLGSAPHNSYIRTLQVWRWFSTEISEIKLTLKGLVSSI